jgi:hypothetical protein
MKGIGCCLNLVFLMTTVSLAATEPVAVETPDTCQPMGNNLQVCWGSKNLSNDKTAPHTAAFSFRFANEFASVPVVTQAINVNGSGHAMAVYSWSLDAKTYSGRLNNIYIAAPVQGTITMSYIAIGQPKK